MEERFELPAELTIYAVAETRDALLAWMTKFGVKPGSHMRLCARAVESVDGAGLQMLAALTNMGVTWHLVDASAPFLEACELMGLHTWVDNLVDGSAARQEMSA